ncbi:MAG TPA: 50S ribosomal protein L10 [Dehalococcoidia bacterium]|nr:50S ribosomal protein L10 [Dehalococcoidia bacterium]
MPTQAKIDQVKDLREKLEKCSIAVTTTYTNISVNEMTELRRQARSAGLDFMVVKNTLMGRAADAAQLPQLKEVMQGPTAVAFGYDEPVDVARILHNYIRTTRSALTIQGAVMGGGPALNTRDVERLSTLPTRPQLIAQLLGQMQGPIYRLLRVLNGPLSKFGYLLQARIRQLEAEVPDAVAEPVVGEDATAIAEAEPVAAGESEEKSGDQG